MRKLSLAILFLVAVVSCTDNKPKNFVSLSGNLENTKDSVISIIGKKGILKKITINNKGSFNDTLKVSEGAIYTLQIGNRKKTPIYLKNGYSINVTGDVNDFLTGFKYTGNGASNSNYIVSQIKRTQKIGNPKDVLNLDETAFNKKISLIEKDFDSILESYSDLDSTLINLGKQQNKQMISYFTNAYSKSTKIRKGNVSPKFENYVDYKGGTKSLDSFKGKYVYIDVWATWCGPCVRQIPFLKSLEKEYHNKNIAFVSISTDESRRSGGSWEAAEKKWRDFVKNKELTGVQLWSGQDFSFQQAYQISGIPRFILIDPNGNIVEANAPRPSDPKIKELFKDLGI